jgi:hypothetical protein
MKKLIIAASISAAVYLIVPAQGDALDFFTDKAAWQAALQQVQSVDIAGQLAPYADLAAGKPLLLPFAEDLTFNIPLQ